VQGTYGGSDKAIVVTEKDRAFGGNLLAQVKRCVKLTPFEKLLNARVDFVETGGVGDGWKKQLLLMEAGLIEPCLFLTKDEEGRWRH
jgi:hypothetical protein